MSEQEAAPQFITDASGKFKLQITENIRQAVVLWKKGECSMEEREEVFNRLLQEIIVHQHRERALKMILEGQTALNLDMILEGLKEQQGEEEGE